MRKKQLRKQLEAFSDPELLTLSFDLRLNTTAILEKTLERGVASFPKVNVDQLLRYMEQVGRLRELAGYVHKNRPAI